MAALILPFIASSIITGPGMTLGGENEGKEEGSLTATPKEEMDFNQVQSSTLDLYSSYAGISCLMRTSLW